MGFEAWPGHLCPCALPGTGFSLWTGLAARDPLVWGCAAVWCLGVGHTQVSTHTAVPAGHATVFGFPESSLNSLDASFILPRGGLGAWEGFT